MMEDQEVMVVREVMVVLEVTLVLEEMVAQEVTVVMAGQGVTVEMAGQVVTVEMAGQVVMAETDVPVGTTTHHVTQRPRALGALLEGPVTTDTGTVLTTTPINPPTELTPIATHTELSTIQFNGDRDNAA